MYYLYVKTHNVIGIKYLGQTSRDPYKYRGSGKRWTNVLKKYGNDVTTEIILVTEDKDEIAAKGKYYSTLWNVVESNEWANIVPEEGTGGDTSDSPNFKPGIANRDLSKLKTEEHRKRLSESCKLHWAKKFSSVDFDEDEYKKMCSDRSSKMWKTRGITSDERAKRSETWVNYMSTHPEVLDKISNSAKAAWQKKSKVYAVTFPDGHIEAIKCLRGWCKERKIPYYKLYNTIKRKSRQKTAGR